MLGWNGNAIPCCRMKAPVPQNSDDAIIHAMPKPLKKPFVHHRTLSINRDLHDYIALNSSGQL